MIESIVPENGSIEHVEWHGISEEVRRILQLGEEALQTNRRGLQRVFEIGAAMEGLQTEAMRESHTNNPIGKNYNAAWNRLATPIPLAKSLHKQERTLYIKCFQKRDLIELWWQDKSQRDRDRWNHPDAILKNYYKDHPDEREGTKKTTTAPRQTLKEANVELQEENEKLRRQLRQVERGDNGPLLTRSATPEEAHRVLREYFGPSKYREFVSHGLRQHGSTVPQIRIKKSD